MQTEMPFCEFPIIQSSSYLLILFLDIKLSLKIEIGVPIDFSSSSSSSSFYCCCYLVGIFSVTLRLILKLFSCFQNRQNKFVTNSQFKKCNQHDIESYLELSYLPSYRLGFQKRHMYEQTLS